MDCLPLLWIVLGLLGEGDGEGRLLTRVLLEQGPVRKSDKYRVLETNNQRFGSVFN